MTPSDQLSTITISGASTVAKTLSESVQDDEMMGGLYEELSNITNHRDIRHSYLYSVMTEMIAESKASGLEEEVPVLENMDMLEKWLDTVADLFRGEFFPKSSSQYSLRQPIVNDWVFVTCRQHAEEVEVLKERMTQQGPENEPNTELWRDVFKLFKKALPETVRFGLKKTAQNIARSHFYGKPGLGKEEISNRLAKEWLDKDKERLSDWAAAWTYQNRKSILSYYLKEYEERIIKGWQQDQQQGQQSGST